jgi:hypothetical protein
MSRKLMKDLFDKMVGGDKNKELYRKNLYEDPDGQLLKYMDSKVAIAKDMMKKIGLSFQGAEGRKESESIAFVTKAIGMQAIVNKAGRFFSGGEERENALREDKDIELSKYIMRMKGQEDLQRIIQGPKVSASSLFAVANNPKADENTLNILYETVMQANLPEHSTELIRAAILNHSATGMTVSVLIKSAYNELANIEAKKPETYSDAVNELSTVLEESKVFRQRVVDEDTAERERKIEEIIGITPQLKEDLREKIKEREIPEFSKEDREMLRKKFSDEDTTERERKIEEIIGVTPQMKEDLRETIEKGGKPIMTEKDRENIREILNKQGKETINSILENAVDGDKVGGGMKQGG